MGKIWAILVGVVLAAAAIAAAILKLFRKPKLKPRGLTLQVSDAQEDSRRDGVPGRTVPDHKSGP